MSHKRLVSSSNNRMFNFFWFINFSKSNSCFNEEYVCINEVEIMF